MSGKRRLTFKGKFLKVIFFFILVVAIALVGGYFYITSALQPVTDLEDTVVEIEQGASLTQVAEQLESKGIIKNGRVFLYYAQYKGFDRDIKAGEYLFTGDIAPDEVLLKLRQGEMIDTEIRFTIPEGLRTDQIAESLDRQGLGNRERFRELFRSSDWDFWFLEEVDGEETQFFLEGFLYPETYQVKKDATEREVVQTMLTQFDKIFDEHFKNQLEKSELNVVDIVTMASIIEREAVVDEERETISGVFYNRIEKNMLLQACATVEYILQENKPVLSHEDTQIESPYNTYQNSGLPPGPIASPGKASIKAALEPEDHDYLYFVSKQDGSGRHVFSSSYEDHLRAKREIRSGQE